MNFELSEDQKVLCKTAADFARRESPVGRLRKLAAPGDSRLLWRKMAELGWLGLLFPESLGGYDGTFLDAALLLEQLGAALVPEPFVPSVLLAGKAILLLGSEAQQQRFLGPLCAGDSALSLAYAERAARFDPSYVEVRASRRGAGYVLSGQKSFVLGGAAADQLVVSARTSGAAADPQGVSLFVLDRDTPGLRIQPLRTMDRGFAAQIDLQDVAVDADRLLGEEGQAVPVLRRVLDLGAAAACAEGVGLLGQMLAMTCEHLKTREQFGVKIGSFQALQHRAVDMFIEVELCKSAAMLSALRADSADEAEREEAVSAAKVQLCSGGRLVAGQAIQLHGGIGITDEHDIGLYFKRMAALQVLFGDESYHLQRYARRPGFETA